MGGPRVTGPLKPDPENGTAHDARQGRWGGCEGIPVASGQTVACLRSTRKRRSGYIYAGMPCHVYMLHFLCEGTVRLRCDSQPGHAAMHASAPRGGGGGGKGAPSHRTLIQACRPCPHCLYHTTLFYTTQAQPRHVHGQRRRQRRPDRSLLLLRTPASQGTTGDGTSPRRRHPAAAAQLAQGGGVRG